MIKTPPGTPTSHSECLLSILAPLLPIPAFCSQIFLLSLWFNLSRISQSWNYRDIAFSDWLLSLSSMHLSFLHVLVAHFLSVLNIPLFGCISVFIHSPTEGHIFVSKLWQSKTCIQLTFFLKIYFIWKQSDRERGDPPSTGSHPKWPQQPESGQSEARSPELHPGLPHGYQGPKHLGHLMLFPSCISREPDQK